MTNSLTAAALQILVIALASIGLADVSTSASTSPNIVVIVTDDQRWDTLWSMPNVQSDLVDRGIEFTNGFVVRAACCPVGPAS